MGQAMSARPAPVELVAQIGTDDELGHDFRVLAWVDGTGAPGESVEGRFLPPQLDPDSGANPRPPVQAEKAGARLFEALFSGPLRRVWARAVEGARRAGGLRLVIRSDAVAVRMLPWELLYDRVLVQGHVALVDGWSVLRQVGDGPPPPPPPAHPSAAELHLSVLVAGDMGADSAQDLAVLLEAWPDGHVNLDSRATLRSIARSSAHVVHVVATGVPGANGWHSLALAADPGEPAGRAVTGAELLDAAAFRGARPGAAGAGRGRHRPARGRRGPRGPHRGRVPRPRLRRRLHRLRPGLLPRPGGGRDRRGRRRGRAVLDVARTRCGTGRVGPARGVQRPGAAADARPHTRAAGARPGAGAGVLPAPLVPAPGQDIEGLLDREEPAGARRPVGVRSRRSTGRQSSGSSTTGCVAGSRTSHRCSRWPGDRVPQRAGRGLGPAGRRSTGAGGRAPRRAARPARRAAGAGRGGRAGAAGAGRRRELAGHAAGVRLERGRPAAGRIAAGAPAGSPAPLLPTWRTLLDRPDWAVATARITELRRLRIDQEATAPPAARGPHHLRAVVLQRAGRRGRGCRGRGPAGLRRT